jgi:outer membrane immunogenic protein
VLGLEGDWQALGKSGTCGSIFQGDPCIDGPANDRGIITTNTSINSMGSVRGRVGVTFDNVMLYGTGGVAFADVSSTAGLSCLDFGCDNSSFRFATTNSTSSVKTGWVAGVGAEWHVIGNWIARGEWLHYDIGSSSSFLAGQGTCDCTASVSQKLHYDVMRLGFNYKFGY